MSNLIRTTLTALLLMILCVGDTTAQIPLYPITQTVDSKILEGYIDVTGKVKIKPQYDRAFRFDESGLAIVIKDQGWGIINADNEFVKEPVYFNIEWIKELNAYRLKSKSDGSEIWSQKGESALANMNPQGMPDSYSEGMYSALIDYKIGFYNSDNKLVIPAEYTALSKPAKFQNGYVTLKKDNVYYIFDTNGKVILETKHKLLNWNGEGLIPIRDQDKYNNYGFINLEGEVVVPSANKLPSEFKNSYAVIRDQDDQIKYINEQGEEVSEEEYIKAQSGNPYIFEDTKTKLLGLRSGEGKTVIPAKYVNLKPQESGTFIGETRQSSLAPRKLVLYSANYKPVKSLTDYWYHESFHGDLMRFYSYENVPSNKRVRAHYVDKNGRIVWRGEWEVPACFSEESLVLMADGSQKKISKIKEGDVVMSFNEQSGNTTWGRVEVVEKHCGSFNIMSVNVGRPDDIFAQNGDLGNTANTTVSSTNLHPFYTQKGGKIMADLENGDGLLRYSEEAIVAQKVLMKSDHVNTVPVVYNLKVDAGNYFVNTVLVLVK